MDVLLFLLTKLEPCESDWVRVAAWRGEWLRRKRPYHHLYLSAPTQGRGDRGANVLLVEDS